MIASPRSSMIRIAAGAGMAVAGLAVLLLVLPSASEQRTHSQKGAEEAEKELRTQKATLQRYQAEAERIRTDRKVMDELMGAMSSEPVAMLHWRLSQKLFDLSQKHGVRLVSVKYGGATREGAKGSTLEAVDVEFTVTGVFSNLKPFMLALEGSKLPFAVVSAKLDESPEGAHLTAVLRAFRQAPGAGFETGEGA